MKQLILKIKHLSSRYFIIITVILTILPVNLAYAQIIIGYLPMWKEYKLKAMDLTAFNMIKLSFLSIENGKVVFPSKYQQQFINNINKLHVVQKQQANLKLLMSVGGWGATGFSKAASNKVNRAKLAKSIIQKLALYNLDGIDLDWEFPVHGGGGIKACQADKENFTLLLEEIRNQLDVLAQKNHKKYYLSIAIAAAPWVDATINFKEVLLYADYLGVMTYNLSGSWSERTAHHAPLFRNYKSRWATSDIITVLLQQGVSPKQIIFGVPFYGRYLANVTSKNKGLHQSFRGNGGISSLSYAEIKNRYLTNTDFKSYYDKKAKADFLYSKKQQVFVTYMGKRSIQAIAEFVQQEQLLGVMVWEITQDDAEQDLTNILANVLKPANDNKNLFKRLQYLFKNIIS